MPTAKKQKLITLTGDKELDAALRQYTVTTQKKYLRVASRDVTKKIVLPDYLRRVPQATGQTAAAVRKAAKVKAAKRSRSSVGSQVVVDDEKFFGALARAGRDPLPTIHGRLFFHLVTLELGRDGQAGQRPLTKALYENQAGAREMFKDAIRQSLADVRFKDKVKKT